MHQLRIQAASRGFPILGDTQYGSAKPFDAGNSWRIALHARSLVFDHPFRKVPVRLEAEIDSQWPISQEWIKELSPVSHQTD
jgi:23S rRNA pseudouridine1911/1915/1917 synthase